MNRRLETALNYASFFPLMLLTTGLLFLGNLQPTIIGNLIYARTEGLLWASSHLSSTLAVVSTGWALLAWDRLKRPFWGVLAMFCLGSIHEALFSRLYYIHTVPVLLDTWQTTGLTIFVVAFALKWGPSWLKIAMAIEAIVLPIYFFAVGQFYPPTVLITGGFNEPWASMPGPNLLDISSWALPCVIFLVVRHWRG